MWWFIPIWNFTVFWFALCSLVTMPFSFYFLLIYILEHFVKCFAGKKLLTSIYCWIISVSFKYKVCHNSLNGHKKGDFNHQKFWFITHVNYCDSPCIVAIFVSYLGGLFCAFFCLRCILNSSRWSWISFFQKF